MLGYLLYGCVVLSLAAAAGGVVGAIVFFLAKRKLIPAIVGALVVFVLILVAVFRYQAGLENDYDRYAGAFDYYRLPLDYPYQLSMTDVVDCACLDSWPGEGACLVAGITHYYKKDALMIGKTESNCYGDSGRPGWFSFDTSTGTVKIYKTESEYRQALDGFGFQEEPPMPTVRENYDQYWQTH